MKRSVSSTKSQRIAQNRQDWRTGRVGETLELPQQLVEQLKQCAAYVGMDTDEYVSYVYSIEAGRMMLFERFSKQEISALSFVFNLDFSGMPSRAFELRKMERILSAICEYKSESMTTIIQNLRERERIAEV